MYMICTYKILFSCEFLPFVRVSLLKAFLNISVYFSKKKKKKCKMLFVKNFQNPHRKLTQINL